MYPYYLAIINLSQEYNYLLSSLNSRESQNVGVWGTLNTRIHIAILYERFFTHNLNHSVFLVSIISHNLIISFKWLALFIHYHRKTSYLSSTILQMVSENEKKGVILRIGRICKLFTFWMVTKESRYTNTYQL